MPFNNTYYKSHKKQNIDKKILRNKYLFNRIYNLYLIKTILIFKTGFKSIHFVISLLDKIYSFEIEANI